MRKGNGYCGNLKKCTFESTNALKSFTKFILIKYIAWQLFKILTNSI